MASTPQDRDLAEQLLVLRAQIGSREAFGTLVERYHARLLFYLRRLLERSADAEDVAQDVWLTALRKLRTLEDPGAFRAWLYRIARHRAISWLRKGRLEIRIPDAGTFQEPAAEDDALDEAPGFTADEAAAVYAALDGLTPAHREVLTLRFLGGLAYEDIAAVLDCRVGTVRSRLHYARQALRTAVSASAPAATGPNERSDPT